MSKNVLVLLNELALKNRTPINYTYFFDSIEGKYGCQASSNDKQSKIHYAANKKTAKSAAALDIWNQMLNFPIYSMSELNAKDIFNQKQTKFTIEYRTENRIQTSEYVIVKL